MIIGFLGKGGSGKTTLATMYTKYLLHKGNFVHLNIENFDGNNVLALDNDHNMDFKFNLGYDGDMNWMGQSLQEIFDTINIKNTKDVADIDEEHLFSLSPLDDLTKKYSEEIIDGESGNTLRLMAAGPHTSEMMYGNMCSHGLTTPLKVYLPFLKIDDHEYVIVDEKAGTDGVGTGVTTGFNLAIVVAEYTTHGVKAAMQIIDMLNFYKTPYIVCVNKIKDGEDRHIYDNDFINMKKDVMISHFIFGEEAHLLKSSEETRKEFDKIYKYALTLRDDRKERTKNRIKKQKDYNNDKLKSN